MNERIPASSNLRLTISTPFLLDLASKTKHLLADATFKFFSQGFRVILTGTTDARRKFHPFTLSVTKRDNQEDSAFAFNSLKSVS